MVDSERLSGTSGSYSLSLQSVKDGNLKDTYQVVLSVENPGEESPSTDSFPLYVYDADALKVQDDKGEHDFYADHGQYLQGQRQPAHRYS